MSFEKQIEHLYFVLGYKSIYKKIFFYFPVRSYISNKWIWLKFGYVKLHYNYIKYLTEQEYLILVLTDTL